MKRTWRFSCNHVNGCVSLIFLFVFGEIGLNVVLCVFTTNRYERTTNKFLQNTFSTLTAVSRVECCGLCDQTIGCNSVNFNEYSKECQLSIESKTAVGVNGQDHPNWSIYSKNGTSGAGGDVYTAWTDGVSVTTDDVTCMTTANTACNQHYRNPVVSSWTSLGVSQVKFAFYKDNNETAFVIFNAAGSDVTNWFTQSRILESSWTTLVSDSFNIFSIIGHPPSRRFFINRVYYGCPSDNGYAVVVTSNDFGCAFDTHSTYPQFLFANTETFGYPNSMTDMYSDLQIIADRLHDAIRLDSRDIQKGAEELIFKNGRRNFKYMEGIVRFLLTECNSFVYKCFEFSDADVMSEGHDLALNTGFDIADVMAIFVR